MPKAKSNPQKKYYPLVSICTPTFNRRPFIPTMFECFKNQTYPKDRIQWIIVDDGTDKIRDLVEESGIKQIEYIEVDKKMTLGAKRNYMHSFAKGTIIVYMDDDDYYPPERIIHAVV
jgi:glycosyltransferase involved in cell wall biosynthesis